MHLSATLIPDISIKASKKTACVSSFFCHSLFVTSNSKPCAAKAPGDGRSDEVSLEKQQYETTTYGGKTENAWRSNVGFVADLPFYSVSVQPDYSKPQFRG
jgi:hypothetical protein